MSTIKVTARRVFPEDKMEEVIALYKALQVDTLKEDGCIHYELFQDTRNKGVCVMIEEWRDMVAFKGHLESNHVKLHGPKLAALGIQPVDFNILQKIF